MAVILLSAAIPRARGASVGRACSAPSRVGAAASGRGCRGRRTLAVPADSPPPSEDPATRDASSTASSSGGQAEDTFESGLNKLWRNDAEFFGARVWQDAERTVRGLRFSTELLVRPYFMYKRCFWFLWWPSMENIVYSRRNPRLGKGSARSWLSRWSACARSCKTRGYRCAALRRLRTPMTPLSGGQGLPLRLFERSLALPRCRVTCPRCG